MSPVAQKIKDHLKQRLGDNSFDFSVLEKLHLILLESNTKLTKVLLLEQRPKSSKAYDYTSLISKLLKCGANKSEQYGLLRAFYYWVACLNEIEEDWSLKLPPVPFFAPAQKSPFTMESRSYNSFVAGIQSSLNDSILENSTANSELDIRAELGRIVLCSIISGHLHSIDAVKAFLKSIRLMESFQNAVWLDLEVETKRHAEPELRRFFIDPQTMALILGSRAETLDLAEEMGALKTSFPKQVFGVVQNFLKTAGNPELNKIPNLSYLLKTVNHHLALSTFHGFAAYAARNSSCHSLKRSCWARIMGFSYDFPKEKVVKSIRIDSDPVLQNVHDIFSIQMSADHLKIRQLILHKNISKKEAKETLNAINIECEAAQNKGNAYKLLSQWAYDRRWMHSKLELATLRGYVSSMGSRLIDFASEVDLLGLDKDGFDMLYREILQDVDTASAKQKISRGLHNFHNFLVDEYAAVPLQGKGTFQGGLALAAVDANILTFDEYQKCLAAFDSDRELMLEDPKLVLIVKLIFIIGFRCGLRRSEVFKLRLADVHLSTRTEILVRPWWGRQLKTVASNRKIPVYKLLEPNELDLLERFTAQQTSEWGAVYSLIHDSSDLFRNGDSPLFGYVSTTGLVLSREVLFGHIHRVMRSVTGDESVRYHHLRHSFATWGMLRLSLAEQNEIPVLFPKQPITQNVLERSKEFRSNVLGTEQTSRKSFYAIASILGHSGPDMSLHHYIHCMDILQKLEKPQIDVLLVCKAAKVSKSSMYRMREAPEKNDLIDNVLIKRAKKEELITLHKEHKGKSRSVDVLGDRDRVLIRLADFLQIWSKNTMSFSDLCNRFEYPEVQAIRYLENGKHLQKYGTRSVSYKENEGRSLSPIVRLTGQQKRQLDTGFDRIFEYASKDQGRFFELCRNYSKLRWKTQNGFHFDIETNLELAKTFVRFCEFVYGHECKLQYQAYKGSDFEKIKKWQKIIGFTDESWGISLARPNKASKAISKTVNIRPIDCSYTALSEGSENPVARILLHLMAIYLI
ncbi:tyrosine-type recombinase/integrase [Sneathiella aquimaris]|uniref:tyrosine-type recombinase/integrase n=1 Tax=Sneathiella aquimaris TaxID=2599305 RepID=UPI00146DD57E|nr:site-specific integrase [Sneathiella aquimaris]